MFVKIWTLGKQKNAEYDLTAQYTFVHHYIYDFNCISKVPTCLQCPKNCMV